MKYALWFMLILSFLLTACSESNESSQKNTVDDSEAKQAEGMEETEAEADNSVDDSNQNEQANDQNEKQDQPDKPTYQIDPDTSSVVPIDGEADEKAVLLTIDDAPDTYTLEMAKTLKDLDAGAIFFVNGHFIETSEDRKVLKQLHDMGFPIGNHTENHQYLPDLSEDEQKEAIVTLNNKIEDIIGERPKFFRAPNGANTDFTEEFVEKEGMVLMNWTYGYDYFKPYMDAEKLTEAMVSGKGPEVDVPHSLLKPGANLLMHDRQWTATALDDIVTGLRDKGYKIIDPSTIQTIQ